MGDLADQSILSHSSTATGSRPFCSGMCFQCLSSSQVLSTVTHQTTMEWNSLLAEVHHTLPALQIVVTVVLQATMEWNSLLAEVHYTSPALQVLFTVANNIWWNHSTSGGNPEAALDIWLEHSTFRGSPVEAFNI